MTGLLLINLGTPDSPTKKDVRKYLDEFLMDERVIDIDYWKRWLLVKGIVLNVRPARSAAAYQKVWTSEGSPLLFHGVNLTKKVQAILGDEIKVALAMRYGNPSIASVVKEMYDSGVTTIKVLPLYPQFAMSTTETVMEKVKEAVAKQGIDWDMHFIPPFFNDVNYLKILSKTIEESIDVTQYDKIIFSYHGIPERQIYKSDITQSHCKIDGSCCETPSPAHAFCYRHQSFEITKSVVQELNWSADKVMNTFQSRLGRTEWLKPYNAATLATLPAQGIKKIAVITPAFVADCLETLEEISMEGKEIFMEAGGEKYDVVPCLNADDRWAQTIAGWMI